MANGKSKKEMKEEIETEEIEEDNDDGEEEEEEQDGVSVLSPCKINSSSPLLKKKSGVDLELRLLEALEIYPPSKLRDVHRHFVLYGLTEYMSRSFNLPFTAVAGPILQLGNAATR